MVAITKDVAAGGVVLVFGVAYAAYAAAQLQLGTFAAMGPGMFPLCIGIVMACVGTAMLLGATMRQTADREPSDDAWEPVEWRSLAAVVAAMAAFAIGITFLGVVPAIFAVIGVAALASDKITPMAVMILSVCLSVAAWVIFTLTLKLSLPLFMWPF